MTARSMNAHISEELPRLLTGDATREVVLQAAEHLRSCPDCQQDLVSAVVAHASLTSAHRFAPEVVAPELPSVHELTTEIPGALPDMESMFAQIRDEAAAKTTAAAARPRHRKQLFAVAAAAVVLAGGGVAVADALNGSGSHDSRTVALSAYDVGDHNAKATITGNQITVSATSLPALDSSHRYEIWLTDAKRARMQPVGFMGDSKTAKVDVPSDVLSQYTDIEVSVQRLNQDHYSGTSVLRGDYG